MNNLFPPQTAPQVTISDADPGEQTPVAAIALSQQKDLSFSRKLPRDRMIAEVKNSRLPSAIQELLLQEIGLIHEKHDLLQLDFIRHAHGGGTNASYTVKEI